MDTLRILNESLAHQLNTAEIQFSYWGAGREGGIGNLRPNMLFSWSPIVVVRGSISLNRTIARLVGWLNAWNRELAVHRKLFHFSTTANNRRILLLFAIGLDSVCSVVLM